MAGKTPVRLMYCFSA